ncbi:heparan-alpha-glucosaminide N-acetyltransferase domain-containing protein [Blastococcus sp. SYSU DS0539]
MDVQRRIGGLDVARGLAVLGMFAAHMRVGGELRPDPRTWTALVDGRSSILFATLAGVSVALLSGRTRPPAGPELTRVRLRIFIRALWVFAIGWLLQQLDTFVAVILGVYGVLFVLVLPFLRWPVRRLLGTAALVAVVVPPLLAVSGQVLTTAGVAGELVPSLLVTGAYPALLWIAFVLVGLAVGRLDLASDGVRRRLAAAGAAAVVAGYGGGWLTTRGLADGVPSAGPEAGFGDPEVFDVRWLTGAEPHSGTTFEVVGSTGFAVLVVVACLLVAERLPRATAPVAAVGALALTVYTAHLVAIRVLMDVAPEAAQGPGTWSWFAVTALAGAWVWRRTVGRGPLEWLLTSTSSRAAGLTPSSPAV